MNDFPRRLEHDPNEKRKQCIGLWLRLLAETKIRPNGWELTNEKYRAYEFELRNLTLDQLQRGFLRASDECKYMPIPVEIREFCEINPAGAAQSYDALKARYEKAYQVGHEDLKAIPSTVDETTFAPHRGTQAFVEERQAIHDAGGFEEFQKRRRLAASTGNVDGDNGNAYTDLIAASSPAEVKNLVLTREQKIMCGIEKPEPEDPVERLNELRRQAAKLREQQQRRENPNFDMKENRREWLAYKAPVDRKKETIQ